MSDFDALRTAAANALAGVPQLRTSPHVQANPTPPCAWVLPDDPLCEYHEAMHNGLEVWHVVVECFVALVADKAAQQRLDAYTATTGTHSLKAALEADGTLGGACTDVVVRRLAAYGQHALGERGDMLGFRLHLDIYT